MLEPFSRVLFMEAARCLNRKASARFARYQTKIGRPIPKRTWEDRRPPPGWYDNDETLVDG